VDQAEVAAVFGAIKAGPIPAPSDPNGKRIPGARGKGGYNRVGDRAKMNAEADIPKKLDLLLKILNHSDNPTRGDGVVISESWRGFEANGLKVKKCYDECHNGDGAAFLAKYAPSNKLAFSGWKCACGPVVAVEE